MKELQNFVYRHMDALKHHKRYLAMLTALSMLVTFIVPLILVEPADSMTGILVCNKTVHTHNAECYVGDTLVCNIEEHIHTNECYKKVSLLSLKGESSSGTPHADNIDVSNAGGGQNEDGSYTSGNAHEFADGTGWYNPAEVSLYTLLFGTGDDHWVDTSKSLEENLEIVDDEYFLGFASDFCAFIESDFTATDADAEGRIFIGGDLTFKNDWNYQVGAGDYGQFKSIWNTDEYGHLKGFASGIIGGKVYRLATMTTGAYSSLSHDTSGITHRHVDKKQNDVFLYPEEGAYKRFIVGNLNASLHYDEDYKTRGDGEKIDLPYEKSCNHLYYDQGCTICDTSDKHDYLGEVNELSQFYLYNDVSAILEKTFDTLRARSLSLASVQAIDATINDNGTLSLDASDIGDAKTVYFKINKWDNVKRVVITVPDDRITYTETGDKEEKYSNGNKTIKNLDLNIIVTCGDEEIKITQNVPTFILAKTANEKPDGDDSGYYGYKISNRGTDDGGNATNNHPVSSNILYNFYNAAKVTFTGDTNFNGTIFAPNASVTAPDACRGHLSGALIAKSFKGGLEFGYRPYRGGTDIFGMASGYAIPVDKVDESGKTLPGALFAVKQDGKFVSLFESGNGTNFAALPSKVDFTGNTPYKPEQVNSGSSERPYVGQEITGEKLTAPVDFTLYTDRNCSIKIVENSNILPKFYLDANQALNIDANENFKCVEVDSNNHIYEIQLIKPVTSLTITGRNPGESTEVKEVTVNFNPMTLKVNNNECFAGDSVVLTVDNKPQDDGITYKYFLNGSQIDYNDSYQLNTAGGATFSVGAYVNIDGQEYEIANATAEKVNVKYVDLAGLSLKLYRKVGVDDNNNPIYEIVSNNAITSGEELQLRVEGETGNATINYVFYNSALSENNTFSTNGIVGKDLIVKAEINVNGNTKTLQDTVTVNFGDDIKFNDYNTTYEVNPYSNLGFNLENIEKYLNRVPDDNRTITFYFKDEPIQSEYFNNAKIDQKLVGEDMTVYAVITANGLVHRIDGKSVTGKYSDNLSLYVESGAFIVGNNIHMNVSNAPVEAEVIFEAVDSKGVTQWTDTQTAYNGTCSAVFPTEVAGDYTIKASIKYENNTPKVLVHPNTITVSPKPVNGNLSVNPSEVYAGNAVELKIYGATIGADVVFTIIEPNGNTSYPKGQIDQSGEYRTTFTPTLSGEHTIKAVISKDGASISLETSLTVKENTSTLNGNLSISSGGVNNPQTVNPGDQVTVNVTNATNGAVLNLTITGPDGKKVEPDSVTISNGTYTYDFNPQDVGTYTVTGKLTSGTQERELEKVVFTIMGNIEIVATDEDGKGITQFTRGEYVTLGLIGTPEGTVRVDYYLDSLNSSTVMKDISDLQCKDTEDAFTVTFKPGQTGIHDYRANAIDANGNVIATVTQEFETVEPTYDTDSTIKFFNSDSDSEKEGYVYHYGETVKFRIYGLSGQINNVQGNIPGVAGLSIQKGNETEEYTEYTFTAPNNTCTDGNLVITINLNQGSPIELVSKITILDTTSVTSLSLRKYLSILAEENLSDNEIEIDVPQGYERISNLKIAFLGDIYEKQSTFKLQAEFTHSGGTTTTQYYDNTNVSGQNPYYLDIPSEHLANNVTKIVITPLEGSITVDKIYPTYIKKENTVVKTSATGFTLIEEDVKVIPVEDWVLALDSITFNLESKKNTNIWYALIEEGKENEASAFSEVRVQNADSISISNLNAENIAQIMVYTEDESLTVKDYTISGFVGDKEYTDEELNELKNNEQHIINYYTLVEQQAPVGYFKEDAIYTIEVDEIIKLNNLVGSCPKEVKTKITVKDKDGNVVLSYTVETIDNENTRTINIIKTSEEVEYVDATFTVTKNDDNEILEVECTNGGVDTSDWSLTKPGGYGAYYFDPEAMMVVPVPTPIKYTNKMGLLFRKIDDNGAAVNGVEIKLYKDGDEVKDNELWYWDENSREHLINFKKLPIKTADNPNPVYKIKETYAGGKYEIADEIYFMRTGEKEVKYWLGSETMPTERTDENQLTVLNFTQNVESRVIRMENIRVVGVKLKLRKTDLETGSKIEGDAENNDYAVFALYANDETELLNPINVENGEVDIAFHPNTVYDTKYVENGYLKPGAYYLREIKAPNGYETSTNDFYFNVVETSDGAYKAEKAEIMSGVTEVKEMQSDGKVHTLTTFKKAALKLISEGIAAETINASTPIIQFKFKTSSGEMGWGNAKFKAKVNGKEVSPNTAKYPSGCGVHENGMSFQSTEVTVEFTVQQLCELFDVEVAKFNTINEFVIDTCNSTTVEDIDFWEIENPINSGNNGSGGGEVSENEIYNTTEEYYDEGQKINETFNVVIVPNGVLDCITDEMITSDATVLSFNIKTSNSTQTEQGWKNYRFAGNFNNQDIVRDKQEVRQETIEQKFTAKRLLEELGITLETESDKLIKQFRMLNSFKIATVNATTVQDLVFYGVADDTGDDTENNAGNDTENNTENTTPATPALKIERETVIIPNSPLGDTMNLRVDKKWVGDSDVTELRKPVNVALKRKAGVNGSYATFKPENQKEEYITLNSLNDWTYTWKDLPRYENGPTDEGDDVLYYYKVEEITTVTGYTSEVPDVNINEGGIVTITNTLEPVSIDVEKIWNSDCKGNVSAFLPQTLTVKLQAKVSDNPETWQDIPGKTLTLTAANKQEGDTEETQTWKGTFENLPKGYVYRIVENVSAVWEVEYKTQDVSTNKETITESFKLENKYNVETGSIAVQKLWQNLTGETTLPYSITVELYRSVIAPSYTETDAPYTEDYKTDYARLLQHSLYFYDANMCGTDVAANSALAWRTNCHTEDEVVGGYHDAGDHAVFGLPQGYTASMLGWTYYEFIKNNTTDVGGKIDSNDAEHLKVILERFYDFFVDSVRYSDGKISEILVQKGDGNVDHSYWGAPEKQTERKTTGEDTEMFWRDYGADIASEYAAALALGYLNFYDNVSNEDKAKYENYLKVAKDLYEFAERNPSAFNEWGVNKDETQINVQYPGFYDSQTCNDDMALAAGWLHLADPDGGYKAKFESLSKNDDKWFSWNDVSIAAYAVGAHIESNTWSTFADKINGKIDENDPTKYFKQDNWGSARYNAIMQTAALVAAKHGQNEETYKTWAQGQMNLLLGGNSWKNTLNGVCDGGTVSGTTSPICLVTNFVPDGVNVDTPQAPHHRAASGWDSLDEYKVNCGYDDDSYALIGAMVGGPAFGNHDDGKQQQMYDYNHDHPLANHTYIDCLHDYCCNEVSIDYNAGLVGAAAGLYYFFGKGERSTIIEGVEYGAYGLTPPTATDNGINSPTNSAVSTEAQTTSIDESVNVPVLKAFAMRQTTVNVLADEASNYYPLEAHTFSSSETGNQNAGYTYTGNYENVTEIQVDLSYSGNFGMQLTVKSGDTTVVDSGWMQNNDSNWPNPSTYLSSIKFENPTTITSLQFWNVQPWSGGEFKITAIRLYYEAGTTFSLTPEKTTIAFNEKIQLTPSGNGTIDDVSDWTVSPAGAATITNENGEWYLTAGSTEGEVTVTATDADGKTGTATINIKDMEITGADSVGIESEITLDKQYAPPNTTKYIWFSSDGSKATVDQNGKVTGVAAGSVTITLEAYDDNNTLLATATKDINVVNIRMETYTDLGQVSNSGSKYFFSLSQLPSGAILKSVSINVSPANGSSTEYEGGLMIGKENSSPEPWNQKNISGTLSPEGQTFTLEESYMTNIDCSKHDFCFGLWNKACTVNINWITFEYEMDSTYIEIKYNNEEVDAKTIRKGQSVNVTVTAIGGEIGSVQLKNGETVQDLGIGGSYEITPDNAGNYTIVAAMAGDNSDKTDSIALTVKDNITINGSEVMDLNGRQTLTVNNTIGSITWNVTAGENYTVEGDEVVTIKKDNETVATFNKSTGVVEVFNSGGEFTITAADSYDGSTSEITIVISERPKVPELPKKVFLESVTRIPLTEGADKEWKLDIQNLPMTDAKGNPYYYYIQEVGYTQVQGGTEKPLTDSVGHYIYSSDAIYMPVSYYNNGITPVKEGTLNVAKVENKFQSKQEATLPSTGGSGVTTYYYLGGVIMLLSIAGFTGLKRRDRKRRKE